MDFSLGNGPVLVTSADVQRERHRLAESRMRLVLMAEHFRLPIPRSCCTHAGDRPCVACTSAWLTVSLHQIDRPRKDTRTPGLSALKSHLNKL